MLTLFVPAPPPLLAAGLDWLEGLLPVLFVLIWIVSQVWAVFRRAAAPQRPVGGPVPRPLRPRADEGIAPGQGPDPLGRAELERQIEAFLRQTGAGPSQRPDEPVERGDRRPATKPQPTPSPGTRTPRRGERRTAVGSRRADTPAGGAPAVAGGDAGAQDRAAAPRKRDTVTTMVGGGDVARHVTEAFASDLKHRISPASSAPPAMPAAPPALGEERHALADLLREPETLRRLVIMREVLDRPVERW